jgi:hypothetical protein
MAQPETLLAHSIQEACLQFEATSSAIIEAAASV